MSIENNIENINSNSKEIIINNYTVYVHTNLINNKKYIGITSRKVNKRWANGKGYKGQILGSAINKYGWDNFSHEIIAENISQESAFKMEQELIRLYNTTDNKYGYNISHGGESGSYHAYNTQLNKIKNVYQYDLLGNFISKYLSIEEAKRKLNSSSGNIVACCKGKRQTASGYQWFYEYQGSKINPIEDAHVRTARAESKEIYQYSLDGNFIKKYNSVVSANKALGTTGLQACARGETMTSAGYRWFYEYKGEKIDNELSNGEKTRKRCIKRVLQFNKK